MRAPTAQILVFIINVNVLFLSNSQLTVTSCYRFSVFIINVNVLFLSNSQLYASTYGTNFGVYHQCQCSLFKQFTTIFLV